MNKVLKKEIMKNYNVGTSFWKKKKHLEVELNIITQETITPETITLKERKTKLF